MSINRRSYDRVSAWQYKNGRVAFMRGPAAILVEDILTSLGAKYIDENRVDFGEWLLSEDFLLAATNGPWVYQASIGHGTDHGQDFSLRLALG